MSIVIADCPRCGAQEMTFDIGGKKQVEFGWPYTTEVFSVCRRCGRSTVFRVDTRYTNRDLELGRDAVANDTGIVTDFVSVKDLNAKSPPEHVPLDVDAAFREAAACLAIGCWNAAGAMFRTCIDLATRGMLPEGEHEGLNARTKRDLGLRLPWLFENNHLPRDLERLAAGVREDGNDGVHAANLTKEDAEDLLDFTFELLERIYTEPERVKLAEQRRAERRKRPEAAQ